MKWKHQDIEIEISEDGLFKFSLDKTYTSKSLEEAKKKINSLAHIYYNMTVEDINTLLNKLKKRERNFVFWLMTELKAHDNNNYCDRGIEGMWKYELEDTEDIIGN